MNVTIPGDNLARRFVIQWNDPFKSATGTVGAQSDLDIFVYVNNVKVAESINRNIVGGDPYELFTLPAAPITLAYEIEILRFAGPSTSYIKCVVFDGDVTFQFPTNLGTSYGHGNVASAALVGAADFSKTPAYGVVPPVIEALIRSQPRFVGPDNVASTFFGTQDSNGVYRAYSTGTAAPHVAAVASLMLQYRGGRRSLSPTQVYSLLQRTAVDMDDPFTPGFDAGFDVGPLTNGVTIANPPRCGWANIEAVLPCGDSDDTVTLELYQGSDRIRQYTDAGYPYFLFGNRGSNVKRGKIPAGSYGIRAQVNGAWSPLTNFTLGGSCK